jgi:hypothetical protein
MIRRDLRATQQVQFQLLLVRHGTDPALIHLPDGFLRGRPFRQLALGGLFGFIR